MVLFDKILHSLSFGLVKIVDMFMDIFYFFAGVQDINGNMSIGENIGNDFLSTLFSTNINSGGPKVTMTTIYTQFALIALGVFLVCFVVGLLKSYIGKKDEISTRNLVYMKTGQSIAWIICMPAIFLLSLWLVSAIISVLTGILSVSMGIKNLNISNVIIESCIFDTSRLSDGWQETLNASMSYAEFKEILNNTNPADSFNYWLFLLAGGCSLFGIVTATLTLVERIIHIFFYYLAGPFVFAKMPLDEGKSFDQWKEMVIGKFFSLAGIVVCAFLFFIIMGLINKMEGLKDNSMLKLVFVIGGIFTFTKAGTLVANLISSNAGQFEGMSQGSSMGMLQGGMRIGAGVARGAIMGSMAMGGGVTKGFRSGASKFGRGAVAGGMGSNVGGAGLAVASANHSADGGFIGGNKGGSGTIASINQYGNEKAYASQGTARQALLYSGLSAGAGVLAGKAIGGAIKGTGYLAGKGIRAMTNTSLGQHLSDKHKYNRENGKGAFGLAYRGVDRAKASIAKRNERANAIAKRVDLYQNANNGRVPSFKQRLGFKNDIKKGRDSAGTAIEPPKYQEPPKTE